jgi:hypothetical protein
VTKAATLDVTLLGPAGKRVARWTLHVPGGTSSVKLRFPNGLLLRPGRYTLVWTARTGAEAIVRRTSFTVGGTVAEYGWQRIVPDRPRKPAGKR